MTWFEEGLQAQKAKNEKGKYENDTRRWLKDADNDIVQDRNGEAELANKLKVIPTFRDGQLTLMVGNLTIARYAMKDGGVEYKPLIPDLEKKFPLTLLESEERFRQHICEIVWEIAAN